MSLQESKSYSIGAVHQDGQIEVVTVNTIARDGAIVAREKHRRTYTPRDSVSDLPPWVQAICATHWTDAIRASFDAKWAQG